MKRRDHNVIDYLYTEHIEDIVKEFNDIGDDDPSDFVEEPTEEMLKEAEYWSQFPSLSPEEENANHRAEVKHEFIYKYLGDEYYEEEIGGKTWYKLDNTRIWIEQEKRIISPRTPNREIIIGTGWEFGESELYICIEWKE